MADTPIPQEATEKTAAQAVDEQALREIAEEQAFNPSALTDEQRAAYAEAKQAQRDELETKVKDLVNSFRDSDTFKHYLSEMSDFNRRCGQYLHHYTPRNLLFIKAQDPSAQMVGSFGDWLKMGRHVAKGEHPRIYVWAPMRETVMQDKLDAQGNPVLDEKGNPVREPALDDEGRTMRRFNGHFKLEPVYDVSQTTGKDLPELAPELKNPVERFEELSAAIKDASPFPIYASDAPEAAAINLGSAKGACAYSKEMIVVKAGMSQEQTLKTMLHELTHAKLHTPEKLIAAMEGTAGGLSKNEIECQAEATAYVVCDHFGLDTSEYSIPYIMSWGEDEKLTPFTKSLNTILRTSDEIINQTEAFLADRTREQTLEQSQDHTQPQGADDRDKPLDELKQEAKERAAEKNSERLAEKTSHDKQLEEVQR